MRKLHIVGRRNSGKTGLLEDLVRELTGRGLRVGTVKHSQHPHELDTPGKDSHRHRQAGGDPAVIITPELIGVYRRRRPQEDPLESLESLFAGCDLVLIEGYIDRPGPKIEVWRAARGTAPLFPEHTEILAVISDDPLDCPLPCWPRSDVPGIADRILTLLGVPPAGARTGERRGG
jgi:molybdopterin-guanine dinucleotide biosynthesis protein MobB